MLQQEVLNLFVLEEVPLGRHLALERDDPLEGQQDVSRNRQYGCTRQNGSEYGQEDDQKTAA
jgi:hypothetical protein